MILYKRTFLILATLTGIISLMSFIDKKNDSELYFNDYEKKVNEFISAQINLKEKVDESDLSSASDLEALKLLIHANRLKLKGIDFWLRYLGPSVYRKQNGQLPVEWELEVFEKHERPQRREGAGLSLAEMYLEESNPRKDHLQFLIQTSIDSMEIYHADSVTKVMSKPDHFFYANRLFILNLASIYTTGFECPDKSLIIPELLSMLKDVKNIYISFNSSYNSMEIKNEYLNQYEKTIEFVKNQPIDPEKFDHFIFIRDYVNPLYAINQKMIMEYKVVSKSVNDLTLNNDNTNIFNKRLFDGQSTKGIYWAIKDSKLLDEIRETGRLLFYDPILSGNVKRSCASCHHPKEYFTDTTTSTNLKFDSMSFLTRNTPTLINSVFNHLTMLDGRHTTLMLQATDVTSNHEEMSSHIEEMLTRVLSCEKYKTAFDKFVKSTPTHPRFIIEHIFSSIIYYFSSFSYYQSPFDDAMLKKETLSPEALKGFNLFMSKARCATCHYVPMFNGLKPPFTENEFEVIGTPEDPEFRQLSKDVGRYGVFPEKEPEMLFAFRTPTLRNANYTKPFMHNGVFKTMDELIDFYDAGGGEGKGLQINTQTLSPDSLKLTKEEKKQLLEFMNSLTEKIIFEEPPASLPLSKDSALNQRISGGLY